MKIVCFGDSLTQCGGEGGRFSDILQDRFPEHQFVNRGVGGDSFNEARARLQADVLDERPDVALIEFGANDWWRAERPPAAWASDLEFIVSSVQKSGARAVVLGVFGPYRDLEGAYTSKTYGADARSSAYSDLERDVASRLHALYLPNIQERIIGNPRCWTDSNHPNEYGNRFVADCVEPVLQELLGCAGRPVRKATLNTTRDFWDEAASLAPDRLAVVDGNRRLTYAGADAQIRALATGLRRAAGTDRPKVAVYLPNCLEYYLLYWAVQRLGGVIVPLNTWLRQDALTSIFNSVEPDLLVVRGSQDEQALRAPDVSKTRVFALSDSTSGLENFTSLFAAGEVGALPEVLGSDLSIIMHTSGTTAAPKGAMMRHSDLMFNVTAAINAHSFEPSDVHLLVNPMFHCTALYSSLPTAAYQKSTVVITASAAPQELMELVQRERITTFLSVPAVFQKILSMDALDRYDFSSLRLMAYAGSPMPTPAVRALRERFPDVALHNFFGLTETISMTHVLRNDDVESRPDSIGKLLPFVEAMIVDDNDRPAGAGEIGELLFAREEIIPGYFNRPGRLEESLTEIDGREWFRTGDLASVDEEGYFFIRGRKKDMIIVGGENVFSSEVEATLSEHPGVREAAVKGIAATGIRSHLGELVKAYVVRADSTLTENELRRHCAERLASYKAPAFYQFVEALPRNPSGKVVKDELG